MKKLVLGVAMMLFSFVTVSAQTTTDPIVNPVKNLSVEILGPSNLIGIHYDSRFRGNSGWGYSVGTAWGFSSSSDFFNNADKFNSISLIPRINYLVGRKNRKLELGFGANASYVFGKKEYDTYKLVGEDGGMKRWEIDKHVKENRKFFGYYFFGNIGYRRQASHGFVFRTGLSLSFGFGGNHSIDKFYLIPYIGFGKSF